MLDILASYTNNMNSQIIRIGGFGQLPLLALGMFFYAQKGVIPRVEVKDCSGQRITSADQLVRRNEGGLGEVLRQAYMEVTA